MQEIRKELKQEMMGGEERLERLSYAGDVVAIHVPAAAWRHDTRGPASEPLLFCGCGPNLLCYGVSSGRLLMAHAAFVGARVHGITSCTLTQAQAPCPSLMLAVHGGAHVALLLITGQGGSLRAEQLANPGPLNSWVLAATLVPGQQPLLAVGKADNSVELFSVSAPVAGGGSWGIERVLAIESTSRQLLYSMSLKLLPARGEGSQGPALWVASGTIFNEVLVWRAMTLPRQLLLAAAPHNGSGRLAWSGRARSTRVLQARLDAVEARLTSAEGAAGVCHDGAWAADVVARRDALVEAAEERAWCYNNGDGGGGDATTTAGQGQAAVGVGGRVVLQVTPAYCLRGHEGSVFGVAWSECGTRLVSTSDDRSARLWVLPCDDGQAPAAVPPGPLPVVLCPRETFWGHGARVWDAALCGPLLATASEDCTARLWDWATGRCLAVLQGHRGRGVWRCALAPSAGMLATAGADASVKLWHLSAWLPPAWSRPSPAALPPACGTHHPSPWPAARSYSTECPSSGGNGSGSGASASVGEFVRVLAFSCPRRLYAATHQGCIHLVALPAAPSLAAPASTPGVRGTAGSGGSATPAAAAAMGLSPTSGASTQPEPEWHLLHSRPQPAPLICLDALRCTLPSSSEPGGRGWCDALLAGTNKGTAALIHVCGGAGGVGGGAPRTTAAIEWQAHHGAATTGVFWCGGTAPGTLAATTSSDGSAHLWLLPQPTAAAAAENQPSSSAQAPPPPTLPLLLAVARSPFRGRMTCAAACARRRALVCGDQDGRVLFFALPPALVELLDSCRVVCDTNSSRPRAAVAVAAAAGGMALPVQLVLSTRVLSGAAHLGLVKQAPDGFLSAGHDGLMRFYSFSHYAPTNTVTAASSTAATATADAGANAQPPLQPAWGLSGTLRIPTIPTIHAVFASRMAGSAHDPGAGAGNSGSSATTSHAYVGGFQGSDMVVYSTAHQAEVCRIPCGGSRRPHAMAADGGACELVAAYIADARLHIHTAVLPPPEQHASGGKCVAALVGPPAVCSLHVAHHGREVNCVLLAQPPPNADVRHSDAPAAPSRAGPHALRPVATTGGGGAVMAASVVAVAGAAAAAAAALTLAAASSLSGGISSGSNSRPRAVTLAAAAAALSAGALATAYWSRAAPVPAPPCNAAEPPPCVSAREAPPLPSRPLVCLTGSEDGTLRSLLAWPARATPGTGSCDGAHGERSRGGSDSVAGGPASVGARLFFDGCEVGEHSQGASVRCIESLPWPEGWAQAAGVGSGTGAATTPGAAGPGTKLVVTAGAKEVLMAWRLGWRLEAGGDGGGSSLRPHVSLLGACPSGQQGADVQHDHRFMAIRLLSSGGSGSSSGGADSTRTCHDAGSSDVLVVAAASDAGVHLLRLSARGSRWDRLGQLECGAHPVLTLAHVCVPPASGEPHAPHTWLVFGGATDGGITAWGVRDEPRRRQLLPLPAARAPLLRINPVHQSGVNALCCVWLQRPGLVALVSAGDDQALKVVQLRVTTRGGVIDLSPVGGLTVDLAHASAIKALAVLPPPGRASVGDSDSDCGERAGATGDGGGRSGGPGTPQPAGAAAAGQGSGRGHARALSTCSSSRSDSSCVRRRRSDDGSYHQDSGDHYDSYSSEEGEEDGEGHGQHQKHQKQQPAAPRPATRLATLLTTGLDQCVRSWALEGGSGALSAQPHAHAWPGLSVRLLDTRLTEVMEPNALHVLPGSGGEGGPRQPPHVAVSGRGVQLFVQTD